MISAWHEIAETHPTQIGIKTCTESIRKARASQRIRCLMPPMPQLAIHTPDYLLTKLLLPSRTCSVKHEFYDATSPIILSGGLSGVQRSRSPAVEGEMIKRSSPQLDDVDKPSFDFIRCCAAHSAQDDYENTGWVSVTLNPTYILIVKSLPDRTMEAGEKSADFNLPNMGCGYISATNLCLLATGMNPSPIISGCLSAGRT